MSQTDQCKNRQIFRFVSHEDIQKYEAKGYIFASHIYGNHGVYSVIMEKVDDNSWRLPEPNEEVDW